MKTLRSFMIAEAEDLPDIYIDLDQVLVSFMTVAEAAIGG